MSKLRTTEMSRVYPLPWRHRTEGDLSAVLASNGTLVLGSMNMPVRLPAEAEKQAHALIVAAVNEREPRP
jgi:hypothetical protein